MTTWKRRILAGIAAAVSGPLGTAAAVSGPFGSAAAAATAAPGPPGIAFTGVGGGSGLPTVADASVMVWCVWWWWFFFYLFFLLKARVAA
jgi:hypothetical protein